MRRREFLAATTALAAMPGFSSPTAQSHPSFKPDPRVEAIFDDLAAPLHSRLMRDRSRVAVNGKEADLSHGYSFDIDAAMAERLAASSADLHKFMSVCMAVEPPSSGYA